MFEHKHLLGLEDLSRGDIATVLDAAQAFKLVLDRPIRTVPALRGKTVVNLFYESSTRTRISFELAEKRLSADAVNFATSTSSVTKGETLRDTVQNIEAMGLDFVVIRHGSAGAPHFIAKYVDASVVNAGDGAHEHPTQGLLDLFTIREKKGKIEGLEVAILGDISHSRVARSNIWGLTKMGAKVRIAGPPTLLPMEVERMGVTVHHRVEEALEGADVINILRIQRERQDACYFPTLREYARYYGIDTERLAGARSDLLVLHPGPINRGVEVTNEVADGNRSAILEQVTNGVAIRMAVLYLLVTGEAPAIEERERAEASA